jgi:hypothetical protein
VLDGELQECARLDETLREVRRELQELRIAFAGDIAEVRDHVHTLARDIQDNLQKEMSKSVAEAQKASSSASACDLQAWRDAVIQAFEAHRHEAEEFRRAIHQDIERSCGVLEKQQNETEQLRIAVHQELKSCTDITRREVDEMRNVVLQEIRGSVESVATLHGALECHASECLGQIGALWVALGQSTGKEPAHGIPLSQHSRPQSQSSVPKPAGRGAIGSPERTGSNLCMEGISQSRATAPCSHTQLPPRPMNSLRSSPAQSVQMHGRCSDVDACVL